MTEKRKTEILRAYYKYYGRELIHCYSTLSDAKRKAWHNIRLEMAERNGRGLTITSYCTKMFTCAYTYTDTETGLKMLCYHTPTRKYEFSID